MTTGAQEVTTMDELNFILQDEEEEEEEEEELLEDL